MSYQMFDKSVPPSCKYCVYGSKSEYSGEILCKKRGITASHDSCRSYRYDPLKREPNPSKLADNYNPEDFVL